MLVYYILFLTIIFIKAINTRVEINYASGLIKRQPKKESDFLLVCVLLFLLMGLRSISVGCDLIQYLRRYRYLNYDTIYKSDEWGYNLLTYFFRDILHLEFQWLIIFVSFLLISSLYFCIKHFSDNWFISIVSYLTLGTFTFNMSGVRQTIAIALCNYAVFCIKKKKPILFILLVLSASTFHNSAVVFLLTYFLYRIKITKKSASIIFLVSLLSFFFKDYIVGIINVIRPEKYSNLDLSENYDINPLVIVVPIVLIIYNLFFLPKDSNGKLSLKDSFFFILSCIGLAMTILSVNNNQLGRLGYYFSLGQIINTSTAVENHKKIEFKEAIIFYFLIIIGCLCYFFISTPGGTLGIDDYKFFWN